MSGAAENSMSMFETVGKAADQAGRSENTLRKLERMNKALRHEEPDRVPISDFFWGSFIERWRRGTGPARRRQSLLPLRSRLDRDRAQHGPVDSALRDAQGDRGGSRGQDRLRRDHAQAFRVSHAGDAGAGRPTHSRSWSGPSSTIRATGGASSRPATTRSPAWATGSSATRLRGLTR